MPVYSVFETYHYEVEADNSDEAIDIFETYRGDDGPEDSVIFIQNETTIERKED
jgi:hypothetical protein